MRIQPSWLAIPSMALRMPDMVTAESISGRDLESSSRALVEALPRTVEKAQSLIVNHRAVRMVDEKTHMSSMRMMLRAGQPRNSLQSLESVMLEGQLLSGGMMGPRFTLADSD
jgi:hypothetical protein